jgi:hypothetical protein
MVVILRNKFKHKPTEQTIIGSGYSEDVKIIKPTKQPKLPANIPLMNSKIAEDKLKIFIDFKF